MQVLLDHLAAIVIGGTVLLLIAFTQFRGQEAAIDGTQYYAAKTHMVDFVRQLQVDLHSLGAGVKNADVELGKAFVKGGYVASGDTTDVFSFQTYADSSAFSMTPKSASEVCYQRVLTGETAYVQDPATGTYVGKPTFQIVRRLNPTDATTCTGGTVTGASMSSLTEFHIELRREDGTVVTNLDKFDPMIRELAVHVRAVSPLAGGQTEHLGGMKQHVDETRWDSVIRPLNLTRYTL